MSTTQIPAAYDPARVIDDLRALADLTGGPGGARRLCWTDEWVRARGFLRERLDELPVTVEIDEAGNLWATLAGDRPEMVVVGSHVDSVPNGGWLDGALGVMAALETLRALRGRRHPALHADARRLGRRGGRALRAQPLRQLGRGGHARSGRRARPARRRRQPARGRGARARRRARQRGRGAQPPRERARVPRAAHRAGARAGAGGPRASARCWAPWASSATARSSAGRRPTPARRRSRTAATRSSRPRASRSSCARSRSATRACARSATRSASRASSRPCRARRRS